MKLWIVGQKKNWDDQRWEFQGVFDSEELAIEACRSDHYFIMPAILNESLPDETVPPSPDGYYPRHPDETRGRGFVGHA